MVIRVEPTLNVDNNVTLGAQLTVTGATEFNSTVDVDANFAVRSGTTDKFTVASSSGNTQIDGTLTVDGETRINDTLDFVLITNRLLLKMEVELISLQLILITGQYKYHRHSDGW